MGSGENEDECHDDSASEDEWVAAKEVTDRAARLDAKGFGPKRAVGDSRCSQFSNCGRIDWRG
jgi:hypothetical protein